MSSQAAPSWQTDGTVWAIASAGGDVFVGGQFGNVRPPGAKPGTDQQPRTYLAEFNATTGALITSFDPVITGSGVYGLSVSPDGKTLYVGGVFSQVAGSYRDNLAAFNIASGALTSWQPSAYGQVNAIAPAPNGQEIYIGGSFNELGTSGSLAGIQTRTYAGAVDASGNLLPWAPVLDNSVTSIAVDPDDSQVLVGGYFANINGVLQPAAGAVDPVTGTTNLPWGANIVPDSSGCFPPAVKTIVISAGTAYLGSEGTGGGCFDGDFAVKLTPTSDSLLWQNDCLGATQALVVIDGYLFKGSHAHDCAFAPGGFPQVPDNLIGPDVTHHLLDQSLSGGSLAHFNANTNATDLGPRAMATDGRQLFVGGDFSTVNNLPQQGFVRFSAGAAPTAPPTPSKPTVNSVWKGDVTVTFPAVSTPDIGTLTYAIYEVGHKTPLGTITATSWPWALPVVHYLATGLKPGTTVQFNVNASDGLSTSPRSAGSAKILVAKGSPANSNEKAVLLAKPSFFWLLDESSGTVAADATSHHFNGVYEQGTQHRVGGPFPASHQNSTLFNGRTGIVTATKSEPSPTSFSLQLWFKTGTNTGGQLAGFGNDQNGLSSEFDRMVYMMNDGQLVFGVASGSSDATIETPGVYNDNRWHSVVATLHPGTTGYTMALYADGALIGTETLPTVSSYQGYWRVGGGNLHGAWNLDPWGSNSQGSTQPNSYYLQGDEADFAVYPSALSPSLIASLYERATP